MVFLIPLDFRGTLEKSKTNNFIIKDISLCDIYLFMPIYNENAGQKGEY